MNRVAVFGSLNMDIIVEVDDFPKVGETIIAKAIDYKAGGKGVNQAAAAAAAGASTILIGTVGEDDFGQQIVAILDRIENLDGARIINAPHASTGVASILATENNNMISVVSGANELTDQKRAEENREIFELADVLLVEFETPENGVKEALKAAHAKGTITILNPAPYREFPKELLQAVSIITPNEVEFEELAQYFDVTGDTLNSRILAWQNQNPDTRLIVTRGQDGLSYVEGTQVVTLPAIDAKTIDSTGAGDTFSGVLAALLSQEKPFEEAVFKAAVAAGLSTEHKGALGSAPKMEEIDLYLSKTQEGADNNNF